LSFHRPGPQLYRTRRNVPCVETIVVPFCFADEDLLFKVEVGREDFNVLGVERDGPGEPIDSDAVKQAIEADTKERERLEDKARQQWIEKLADQAEDADEARAEARRDR
jgi:hypothetical protein